MTGRPSIYSQELADTICGRIADGESLRSICDDEGMPARDTVRGWLQAGSHPEFSVQYARARELQADTLADEILTIADDDSRDWELVRDDEGRAIGVKVDGEHVQRSRLRIDARKWFAGKVAPKKYGDVVRQEHTGLDGQPVSITFRAVYPETEEPGK